MITISNWSYCTLEIFPGLKPSLCSSSHLFRFSMSLLQFFKNGTYACYPCRPWCRWVNHLHIRNAWYRDINRLPSRTGLASPMICKHGAICCWWCILPVSLARLGTPFPSQFWVTLGILLNWMLYMLHHIWSFLGGEVTVRVEPSCMVSVGVIAPPEL